MSINYRAASGRHLHDGRLLLGEQRSANADHLFGLSAECSLKAVMEALGMKMKADGSAPVDRGHKVHMPALWAAFQSFARGQLEARYVTPLDHGNPFSNWKIDQRYWDESDIPRDVAEHERAAAQCVESMEALIFDGVW